MSVYPGNILTATAASVSADPASTRAWAWLRNGTAIPAQTADTYLVTEADIGAAITALQTETNFLGSASAASTAASPIAYNPATLFALAEPGVWLDPSDLTTLFQDAAGTTPVTAPGQPVGLVLDKSQGLVLGSELVTNGDFSAGSTGWTGGTVSGGQISIVLFSEATQAISLTAGRTYRVSFDINASAGMGRVTVGGTLIDLLSVSRVGAVYYIVTTNTTALKLGCISGTSVSFDNVSVKELPGNHATQGTAGSRPIYGINPFGGRRNLLERTEDFSNAVWSKSGTTASPHNIADPDGGTTASTITATTANGFFFFNTASNPTVNSTASLWIRRRTGTGAIRLRTNPVGPTETTITVTSSWQRVSVNVTARNANDNLWVLSLVTSGDAVDIWHPQLETGSTATNYQRVTDQYDVTEAGVPSVSYLRFDTSKFLVTPTITPGTDKAQVFVGVRKNSDANIGVLVEYSTTVDNAGTFAVYAPNTAGTYSSLLKGSALGAINYTTFTAPITNVVTNLYDIAQTTIASEITFRANGAVVSGSSFGAANAGTGNFLAYPLYIGIRGSGTTLPFTGQIYSLIVRFGATLPADDIAPTETWVAGKTGISIANNISPTIFARDETAVLDRFNQTIERRAV